ncbi:uncharacterized protein ARMOST_17014 [Armillaria ostoyae]|uniref:Uncharacterized protein n=1 Tax=Armillaria ostoyae TaxID=47428 RepID=A0A284RXU6_ARMOS|nr:uncharacterized protein ARMOST_17014 [Armillaria ostoyae]
MYRIFDIETDALENEIRDAYMTLTQGGGLGALNIVSPLDQYGRVSERQQFKNPCAGVIDTSSGWVDLYLREPTINGQLGIPVTATVLTEEDVPTTYDTPFN